MAQTCIILLFLCLFIFFVLSENLNDFNKGIAKRQAESPTKPALIRRCPTNSNGKRIRCRRKKRTTSTTTTTTTTLEPGIPSLWLREFQLRPIKDLLPTTVGPSSTTKNNLNISIPTTTLKTTTQFLNTSAVIMQSPLARMAPPPSNLTAQITITSSTLPPLATTTNFTASTSKTFNLRL